MIVAAITKAYVVFYSAEKLSRLNVIAWNTRFEVPLPVTVAGCPERCAKYLIQWDDYNYTGVSVADKKFRTFREYDLAVAWLSE